MPRFFTERATPDEADILVEGRITLHFRRFKGSAWKVGATPHDRKKAKVPDDDFREARKLAKRKMDEAREAENSLQAKTKKLSPREIFSDEDIALLVMRNARNRNISIHTALDIFFDGARWCDTRRRYGILQEIGRVGGAASKKRASARRREREKARQFNFNFTQ